MTNAWKQIIVGNSYTAGGGASVENTLTVSDGAYVKMANGAFDVGEGKGSNDNLAEFTSGATADLRDIRVGAGNLAYDNTFSVDQATINASRIYVGYATNTARNVFTAKNAKVTTTGEVIVGNYDTHSPSNRLELAGGEMTVGGNFYIGCYSSFCSGTIADGALVTAGTNFMVGVGTNAHSNRLDVLGKSTVIATAGIRVGSNGSHNELVVDDSALYVTNASNGALLSSSFASASSNNLMYFRNGAYVLANRFHLNRAGHSNTLFLSNAVVEVSVDTIFNTPPTATGNRLVFAGTNSVYRSLNQRIPGGSLVTYEFRIPRGGYVDAPLQSMNGQVGFTENASIVLDLTQFERGGGGDQVLARGSSGINMTETTLASLNQQIVEQGFENCTLVIVDKELVLKTPHTRGLVMIIR